jgi:hypothetical protein
MPVCASALGRAVGLVIAHLLPQPGGHDGDQSLADRDEGLGEVVLLGRREGRPLLALGYDLAQGSW